MLVKSSVGCALVALGFLFAASLAAAGRQVKHGPTRTTRPEPSVTSLPRLLHISPETPADTVITAVGAVTTLDFGDEKPLRFISGLREQLGVEQSSAKFPGNLIHL